MSAYYDFLATGMDRDEVIWTEPYEDANGLGQIVTAAMPVYDRRTSPPGLVAVVVLPRCLPGQIPADENRPDAAAHLTPE